MKIIINVLGDVRTRKICLMMEFGGGLADGYFERTAGDVVRSPPDCERVVSLLVGLVRQVVDGRPLPLVGQLRHRVARRRYHSNCQQTLPCDN